MAWVPFLCQGRQVHAAKYLQSPLRQAGRQRIFCNFKAALCFLGAGRHFAWPFVLWQAGH